MNLLGNAIKFTPKEKSVHLNAMKEGDWILFQIIDKGIGIPKDRQEAIFDAFEQVDPNTTRHFEGTGLGLAITKKMVNLLGGEINVKSTLGEGAIFSVKIPLVESSATLVEKSELNFHDFHFSKDNVVLLVEDNPINRDMLIAFFDRLGISLHTAKNGKRGVEKTLLLEPDLILMDLHMPKMDGLAAAKIIWAEPKVCKIPIVMLSADALSEQKKAAYAIGIQEYLTKPLDFMKLFKILVKYLRQDDKMGGEKSCLPLPENIEKQLVDEFKKLSQCSILDGGELVDKIAKMQIMCQCFDCPYCNVLSKIENAVFNGDEEEFNYLLKKFNRKQ